MVFQGKKESLDLLFSAIKSSLRRLPHARSAWDIVVAVGNSFGPTGDVVDSGEAKGVAFSGSSVPSSEIIDDCVLRMSAAPEIRVFDWSVSVSPFTPVRSPSSPRNFGRLVLGSIGADVYT